MDEAPRFEVAYYCSCGGRLCGWSTDEAAHEREKARWSQGHRGEGHRPVSQAANRKARIAKGMRP